MRQQMFQKKVYSLDVLYELIEEEGKYYSIKELDIFFAKLGIFLKSTEKPNKLKIEECKKEEPKKPKVEESKKETQSKLNLKKDENNKQEAPKSNKIEIPYKKNYIDILLMYYYSYNFFLSNRQNISYQLKSILFFH